MRIGIFGGSFNPVHYGHLLLAECCREQAQLDRVWFIPAANPPHKEGGTLASAQDRLAMLRLAIAGHESFEINPYEIDRGGTSYTVETLRHLCQTHEEATFFLLVGADMMADLPNWREAGEICRLALPLAVRRAGEPAIDFGLLSAIASKQQVDQMRRHAVEMPPIGISSTNLRRRIAESQSIRYRTPRAVEEYIRNHGLYQ